MEDARQFPYRLKSVRVSLPKTMKKIKTEKSSVLIALICTIFIATGQLFFKLGSAKIVSILSFFNLFIIIGALSYFIGSILYIISLKKGELSVIAPIFALNFVWVGILSMICLNEAINTTRWIGIATVAIGVGFIGIGGEYGN